MADFSENKIINDVSGKRVAILGLGVSNFPLTRMLAESGACASITVFDEKTFEQLGERAEILSSMGVSFVCGFEGIDADIIFRSPGLRPDEDEILRAVSNGAHLTSEMETFLKYTPAVSFAVTGSDGKTTTTTLTGRFLSCAGNTYVGGNIGTPLLDKCHEMTDKDFAALELSSFQLMNMQYSPMNAAITNVTPNHLDWHTDEGEYARAKFNIVGEKTRRLVVNADNEITRNFGMEILNTTDKDVFFFSSKTNDYNSVFEQKNVRASLFCVYDGAICKTGGEGYERILPLDAIKIPGKHNVENYMTAIALTYGYVEIESYEQVAKDFFGVEHRLELVREKDGVQFYNGSIDSSPTRTIAALSALEGRDIVVICGGYDKKLDYAPLASALIKQVRAVVLTGATAEKIKLALYADEGLKNSNLQIIHKPEFEDAVFAAAELGREGGCVLLSPASASFDRFDNFMVRGNYFKELVGKL